MAKLTKEERAELEARLAADDEDDDDESDEVELGLGEGRYFRGSMRRARGVAGAHGFKLEPDPPKQTGKPRQAAKSGGGGSGDGGSGDGGEGDEGGRVVFGRRQSRAG